MYFVSVAKFAQDDLCRCLIMATSRLASGSAATSGSTASPNLGQKRVLVGLFEPIERALGACGDEPRIADALQELLLAAHDFYYHCCYYYYYYYCYSYRYCYNGC